MKFCSFDIETATLTPDNEDPHKYRPLGIACAATQLVDTDLGALGIQEPVAWFYTSDGAPDPDIAMFGPKMSVRQTVELVDYLFKQWFVDGYAPLTWNGLGFDFDILAEESNKGWLCSQLALYHYDMAFQMLCDKGYMIGMQAAALGLGLHGKSEGMHGDLAPVLWAKSRADQEGVLEYVKQDVQTTSEIALRIIETSRLSWISKAGKPQTWQVEKLLDVQEALKLPKPDTKWMTSPRTRESCYRWTEKYLEAE